METILFICTHNSSRSILAEALINRFSKNYTAQSAGTEKTKINSFAIKVLNEINIDTSNLRSKEINEFVNTKFDYVVTVCDSARETCPFFPAKKKIIHAPFPDPSIIGENDEEKTMIYRKTRDDIASWLASNFELNYDLNNL